MCYSSQYIFLNHVFILNENLEAMAKTNEAHLFLYFEKSLVVLLNHFN